MSTSTPHFRALDGWRGLCALLVALYHFPGTGRFEDNALVRHADFFVDFFFVLSGFVIAANYLTRLPEASAGWRFMALRLGRLYPLHLAVFAAFLGFEWLQATTQGFGAAFNGMNQTDAIATNMLLIQSWGLHDTITWNGPSWSISTEMAAYAVFALITLTAGSARFWIFGATLFVSLGLLWRLSDGVFLSTADYGLLRCFAGFFAGVFAFKAWETLRPRAARMSSPAFTLAEASAASLAILFVCLGGGGKVLSFAAPFVFAAAVIVFSFDRGALSRLLHARAFQSLGLLSYSIYMVHTFLALRFANLMEALSGRLDVTRIPDARDGLLYAISGVPGEILSIAFLALVIAASALTYRFIEVPGRDLVRRWLPGNANTQATA